MGTQINPFTSVEPRDLGLISRIYDLPLQPQRWRFVLDEFVARLNGGLGGVVACETVNARYRLNVMTSNFTDPLLQEYNLFQADASPSPFTQLVASRRREFVSDLKMLGLSDLEEYRKRPAVQWLHRRFNILHGSASCLNLNRAWSDILLVMFPADRGPMTAQERETGHIFLDHFAKVVELDRAFDLLRSRFHGVFSALDRFQLGVCLLSSTGAVMIKNREATRILEAGDGVTLSREGYLHPMEENSRRALKDAVGGAAATADGKNNRAETLLVLERRSGKEPYLVEVSPLRDEKEFDDRFRGSLVLIIDPARTDTISTRGMDELYRLTGAESEVCRLLAEGMETDDIADFRNITRETVRNCIKQVLHKTGTRNRAQLIRLALKVNLPIDDKDAE